MAVVITPNSRPGKQVVHEPMGDATVDLHLMKKNHVCTINVMLQLAAGELSSASRVKVG